MIENADHIDDKLTQHGIVKNTFWIYAWTFIIAPLQYLVRIVIAKNLPLDQVGIIYALLGLTGILSLYNDLGFREAIGFYYPKYLAAKDYNKAKTILVFTLVMQLISSIILASLLWFFSWLIAEHYLNTPWADMVIKIFWGYLIFNILYNFVDGVFMLYQDAFWNKIISVINYIVLVILTLSVPYWVFKFVWVQSNLTGFIFAQIIPSIVWISLGIFVFLKKYRKLAFRGTFTRDKAQYSSVQKYALGVLFVNNITYLLSTIDVQISTYLFGPASTALYSYGMMLTNLFITLLWPIGILLYPLISHLNARNKDEMMNKVFYAILNYMGLIALVGSAFLWAYSSEIMTLLFGQNYAEAGSIIKRNLPFVFFGVMSGIIYTIYAGMGLIKKRIKMLVIVLIINIITNFALSTRLGIRGTALTMGLTWLILFLYGYWDLRRGWLQLKLNYKLLIKNIVVAVVTLLGLHYFIGLNASTTFKTRELLALNGVLFTLIIWITNLGVIKNSYQVVKQLRSFK